MLSCCGQVFGFSSVVKHIVINHFALNTGWQKNLPNKMLVDSYIYQETKSEYGNEITVSKNIFINETFALK